MALTSHCVALEYFSPLERLHWKHAVFTAGSIVDARYSTGQTFYRARIVEEQAGGKFEIEWEDKDVNDRVKSSSELKFQQIERKEWKLWVDGYHKGPFPSFPRAKEAGKPNVVRIVLRLM